MAFDQEYYERFYFDPKTASQIKRRWQSRARLIAAYALHTGLPVRRILDAGCGTGLPQIMAETIPATGFVHWH